jgi:isopentenyldiphosphate isomerase
MTGELMDVVNHANAVIGSATVSEVYERKLSHRIVHVFVLNQNGEVYLQQRALTDSFLPGYWCTSAGGHVRKGESYEDAARRELEEELGLKDAPLAPLGSTFQFQPDEHQRHLQVFVAFSPKSPAPNKAEVHKGKFFDLGEAIRKVKSNKQIHPQLQPCLALLYENRERLKESLIFSPKTERELSAKSSK